MESNWGVLVAKEQLTGLACLPATRCAMASATSHPSSSSARAGAGRSRQMIWARVILSTNDGGRCLACSRKSSTRVRSNSTQPYVHAHNLVMVPHPPPFVKLTHCPHAVFPLLLAPLLTSHILLPASQYTTDHSALPTSPFTYSLHSSTAPAAPRRTSHDPAPTPCIADLPHILRREARTWFTCSASWPPSSRLRCWLKSGEQLPQKFANVY